MAGSTRKANSNKRRRIKVGKLDEGTQKVNAKELKKVKGGAPAQSLTFNLQEIQQTLNRVNE